MKKRIVFFFISLVLLCGWLAADDGYKERVETNSDGTKTIYKYKDYEKYDLEELNLSGSNPADGQIAINPRKQREFENKLPDRPNFDEETYRMIVTFQ